MLAILKLHYAEIAVPVAPGQPVNWFSLDTQQLVSSQSGHSGRHAVVDWCGAGTYASSGVQQTKVDQDGFVEDSAHNPLPVDLAAFITRER